jgi:hypothetical protein
MRLFLAVLAALLAAVLLINTAHAQRVYHQGELDAMLAPIALQPDGVVSQVLIASTYPDQVTAAARWARANAHLRGDDAVRAVYYEPWDPAVKARVAFPELLLRMEESPQWLNDLGQAFLSQEAQVMDTVQELRRRAQATGHLSTTDQQAVYDQGGAIVVEPRTEVVYVRYYDPYIVYGPWWWPYYRPVFWHPWALHPVFVTHGFFYAKPDWRRRHVHVAHRPVHVHQHQHKHVVPGRWQPVRSTTARAAVRPPAATLRPPVRVPEAQRRPIVNGMPAASGFTVQRGVQAQHPQAQHPQGRHPQARQPQVQQPQVQRPHQPRTQNHQPRGQARGQGGSRTRG